MGTTLIDEAKVFEERGGLQEVVDHYNVTAAFAGAISAGSPDDQYLDVNDGIVGFNARESTDAVLAAFGRAERIIQIARAMYAERPSHAAPMTVPDIEVEMCVMQAIGEASSMVNA